MITTFKTKTSKIVVCGLFAALISIGAFIQIPLPNTDYFTLQFLFVLFAGLLLGSKLGATAAAVYVITGLMGFPVFAAGGGITYVLRPTFGYLIGFIATAFITGFVCEKLKAKKFNHFLIACLCGFIATYTIGLTYKYFIMNFYMGTKMPFIALLLACFPLDIPGDLVSCALASVIAVRICKFSKGKVLTC